MLTYIWQGSVLYEDGARISEVGIKDGCSIHLAIYSTDHLAEIQRAEIQLNRALLPKELDYLSAKLSHDLLKAAPTADKKRLKADYDKMNGLKKQLGESADVLSPRKVPKTAAQLQRQVRTPSFR